MSPLWTRFSGGRSLGSKRCERWQVLQAWLLEDCQTQVSRMLPGIVCGFMEVMTGSITCCSPHSTPQVQYCSKQCQEIAWRQYHKEECEQVPLLYNIITLNQIHLTHLWSWVVLSPVCAEIRLGEPTVSTLQRVVPQWCFEDFLLSSIQPVV